jgi:UDP-3-O-[3-hydroxymyristoyl] glucosamine N-acyltransferase
MLVILGRSPMVPDLIQIFDIRNYRNINTDEFDKNAQSRDVFGIPYDYITCIGSPRSYDKKFNVIGSLPDLNWTNLIQDHIKVKFIGRGNIIMPNSYISPSSVIGNHNFIMTGCTVHHDSYLGNCVTLASNVVLCGGVYLSHSIFIGANSTIKENTSICDNVLIGANSFVNEDIFEAGVYAGSPARRINDN